MVDVGDVSSEWDHNAERWSASISQGIDRINEQFGVPFFMDAIGDVQDLEVLDAGCGEGRSSRHLAARGARVTGVDVSSEMIAEAVSKESQAPLGTVYHITSCADLKPFSACSFDLVTSFMALMDTPQLSHVLQEFYKVVRPGGKVAVMVRHPCFFTPGFSVYSNRTGVRSGLRVSHYFAEKPYKERWKFQGQEQDAFMVTRFPYTLSDYVNTMLAVGFSIASLSEPRPSGEVCARLPNLAFWRLHAALYLFILGVKT